MLGILRTMAAVVRPPARHEREHVHLVAGLGDLDDRHQAGQATSDDDEARRRVRHSDSGSHVCEGQQGLYAQQQQGGAVGQVQESPRSHML